MDITFGNFQGMGGPPGGDQGEGGFRGGRGGFMNRGRGGPGMGMGGPPGGPMQRGGPGMGFRGKGNLRHGEALQQALLGSAGPRNEVLPLLPGQRRAPPPSALRARPA